MNTDFFKLKQHSLIKSLLFGHFLNIIFGAMVFITAHWGLGYSAEFSVFVTAITTLLGSTVTSFFVAKRISLPISVMHNELHELHTKIDQSNNVISEVNQTSQALLEDLPIGCLVFNKSIELVRANKRAYELLGFNESTPTSTQLLEILKELKSGSQSVNFVDWIHQSKTHKIQALKRWPMVQFTNGDYTSACDVLVNYNKNDSNDYEFVILLVDRTEEYERQEKQMEFISLAAHELRGPVTVMRGLIDILEGETKTQLSDEHKKLLTRMGVSARQLAGYIDNILSVSRIDREDFEVKPSEVSWQELVTRASEELAIRAKAHNKKLQIQMSKDLPAVAVDSSIVLHVINNLIDNAIKYSPENGDITIASKLKEDMIETTIQDSGIGIPANVVDGLFTKFYRSHKSKNAVNGTGLGLYLCKAIVEAHGGNIWVRSTEGAGTTFGFTLPTYESVAQQLKEGDNTEDGIIRGSHGWIKNHALYRR